MLLVSHPSEMPMILKPTPDEEGYLSSEESCSDEDVKGIKRELKPNQKRRKEKLAGIPSIYELRNELGSHFNSVEYFTLHEVLVDRSGEECNGFYETKWGRNGPPEKKSCGGILKKRKFRGEPEWSRYVVMW